MFKSKNNGASSGAFLTSTKNASGNAGNKKGKHRKPATKEPYDLHQWGMEGEDHINVDEHSMTELGRMLCTHNEGKFHHPLFGTFMCIRGYVAWIQYRDHPKAEDLRKAYGQNLFSLIAHMKRTRRTEPKMVRHFRALVAEALQLRIEQTPKLAELLAANKLSFDSYGVSEESGYRSRDKYNHLTWFSDMIEDMSEILSSGGKIDPLLWTESEDCDESIHVDMIPEYQRRFLEEKAAREQKAAEDREEAERLQALLDKEEEERVQAVINHPDNKDKSPNWVPPVDVSGLVDEPVAQEPPSEEKPAETTTEPMASYFAEQPQQ